MIVILYFKCLLWKEEIWEDLDLMVIRYRSGLRDVLNDIMNEIF